MGPRLLTTLHGARGFGRSRVLEFYCSPRLILRKINAGAFRVVHVTAT